MVAFED